jgi:hypothetical protein
LDGKQQLPELWEKWKSADWADFQAQWETPLFGVFHAAAFSIAHSPTDFAIEP